MPKRPRIAYLITNSETGGAQTHVADLLRAMRGQADVTLLAGGDGPLFDLARELGIPSTRLATMDNALSPFKALAALQELTTSLRGSAPDIIHTHSAKASALGRIAGRILGVPVIYTVHGFAFKPAAPWKQRTVARIAEWLLAQFTSRVICVAEGERAMARSLPIPEERIHVIRNGIADTPFRATPAHPLRRIVSVARLAAPKRPDLLIRAFAAANLTDCELAIAGDGPQRAALEQLADDLAPGRVRFLGSVTDVPELLASAQIFCLVSDHEASPISILEAMRAGMAVIGSDLPGIRDQLDDGQCGVLVGGNDQQRLTKALQDLAGDAWLRSAFGDAARTRWAQHYGLDPMVRATWQVYEQALSTSHRRDARVSAS